MRVRMSVPRRIDMEALNTGGDEQKKKEEERVGGREGDGDAHDPRLQGQCYPPTVDY